MNTNFRNQAMWLGGGLAAGWLTFQAFERARMVDLHGKTVLITGGSRGLGLALARRFAEEGCAIVICARDTQELERARLDLAERGADVMALPCDVGDPEQVRNWIDAALNRFGRIDILVNNAGVIQVGPLESMTLDDFERAMRIMFWGTVYPVMTALPHMLARGEGRIVNITSIGGKVSMPHLLPYNCAKFAVVGFSEGLAAELAGKGVHVTTIAPGLMRTGSFLGAEFKGDHQKESSWFGVSSSLPLVTMSAERAARQIVCAVRRGEAVRVLTVAANMLDRFHALWPGFTVRLLGLARRAILTESSNAMARKGAEVETLHSPVMSALTWLSRRAAVRLHETHSAQDLVRSR